MPAVVHLLEVYEACLKEMASGDGTVTPRGAILMGDPAEARMVVSVFALSLRVLFSQGSCPALGVTLPKSLDRSARCLVVSSASNLKAWRAPLYRHASQNDVALFHGGSVGGRRVQVHRLQIHGGVCLTTYGMLPKMGALYPGGIATEGAEGAVMSAWHCAVLDQAEVLIDKPTGTRCRHLEELGHLSHFLVLVPSEGAPPIHPIDAQARWPGMEFDVVPLGESGEEEEDTVMHPKLEQFVREAIAVHR